MIQDKCANSFVTNIPTNNLITIDWYVLDNPDSRNAPFLACFLDLTPREAIKEWLTRSPFNITGKKTIDRIATVINWKKRDGDD